MFKKYAKSLTLIITISFFVLLSFVSLLFFWSLNQDFTNESSKISAEANVAIGDTISILSRRTTNEIEDGVAVSKPLVPIEFFSHPSPFSQRDLSTFGKYYPPQTYLAEEDITTQAQIILGYSPVQLSSGNKGLPYLSVLIWLNSDQLKLYSVGEDLSRTEATHLWLSYHAENKLNNILVSFQENQETSESENHANISGYLANNIDLPTELKLEPTVKGTIYKNSTRGDYAIIFRIRLKSTKSLNRPTIDIKKPIGIKLNLQSEGTFNLITTYRPENNQIQALPPSPEIDLSNILSVLPSSVRRVELPNLDTSKTKVLLERKLSHSNPDISAHKRLLWSFLMSKLKKKGFTNLKSNTPFQFYKEEKVELFHSDGELIKLRVILDSSESINEFFDNEIDFIIFYFISIVAISSLGAFIYFYMVLRIKNLTDSIMNFNSNSEEEFYDSSLVYNDEIGELAKHTQNLLSEMKKDAKKLAKLNKKLELEKEAAEIRYSRQVRIMSILGHDIKTPVAALLPLLRSLDSSIGISYVTKIQRASNSILETAKIDKILNQRSPIPQNLYDFCKSMALNFQNTFPGEVVIDDGSVETWVYTDIEFLESALDEILSNALDFASKVSFLVSKNNGYGVISIASYGPLIPEDKIDSIFDYGVSIRDGNEETRHDGFGLFSAYEKIIAQKGKVRALNQSNHVLFEILLPLSEKSDTNRSNSL